MDGVDIRFYDFSYYYRMYSYYVAKGTASDNNMTSKFVIFYAQTIGPNLMSFDMEVAEILALAWLWLCNNTARLI